MKKALYYVDMGEYVTCTYSDGTIRVWHFGDKGHKSARGRARRSKRRGG